MGENFRIIREIKTSELIDGLTQMFFIGLTLFQIGNDVND